MTASGEWPSWATEPVEILDHDPKWRQLGEHLSTRLDSLLASWLTRPTEHVGSTAIPGLAAKPIIDIQASVTDFRCTVEVADALRADGWHAVPAELDQRPWRLFYVLPEGGRRTAHLHLLIDGSTRWHEQLAFRDTLRSNGALRDEYARLKRDLAVQNPDDREAYTRGKATFIREVVETSWGADQGHRTK